MPSLCEPGSRRLHGVSMILTCGMGSSIHILKGVALFEASGRLLRPFFPSWKWVLLWHLGFPFVGK